MVQDLVVQRRSEHQQQALLLHLPVTFALEVAVYQCRAEIKERISSTHPICQRAVSGRSAVSQPLGGSLSSPTAHSLVLIRELRDDFRVEDEGTAYSFREWQRLEAPARCWDCVLRDTADAQDIVCIEERHIHLRPVEHPQEAF
ncbi:hypothetical protein Emag_003304 [Eimeria magna]